MGRRILALAAIALALPACGSSGGGGGAAIGTGGSAPPVAPQYDPAWGSIAPVQTLTFTYNNAQTSAQNGAALQTAMKSLTAGQKLVIGAGTYTHSNYLDLTCTGASTAPVFIEAASGAAVTIVQSNTGQNIMNVGQASPVRYVAFRGITWTGGSSGLRFYDCAQIWLDRCTIHGTGDAAITTNTHDTDHFHITRNEIYDTGGTGEGMYLGANNGAFVMSESIIALNHVHDTDGATVTQGDGIELKQGSWGNLIAENTVHANKYPCILVYGTAGKARNIVERNVCYGSGDNAMQVQGECIVRNNLVISAAGAAFASQVHQGNPINLQVVHNTFVNSGRAVNLSAWSGAAGMVFANNACYSQTSDAIRFSGGSAGVTVAGNVVSGPVVGVAAGFTATSNGLADFTDVTWDGSRRNAMPSAGSKLIGAGAAAYAVPVDLTGATRTSGLDAGCHDRP